MEEILSNLLERPLAFIISLAGIVFLGLSGLTRIFQIEVEKTNSKRLFIAGLSLLLLGIPIYYFIENKESNVLDVELLDISFYQKDEGHRCDTSRIHIRETYKIDNTNGEKLYKLILNGNTPHIQEIIFKDEKGNYALNYCFKPNHREDMSVMFVTNSGKSSNKIKFIIDSNKASIKPDAPRLSKF